MKIATVKLVSESPICFGKFIEQKKNDKETHEQFEDRIWRERAHVLNDKVIIPPMMLKHCLDNAAQRYVKDKIPGLGKAQYNKLFDGGVMCFDQIDLGIAKADLKGERVHVPSDGKRGGTTRVMKHFPIVEKWTGDAIFYLFDDLITKEIFEKALTSAGKFVGMGVFSPRARGYYGRFKIEGIQWKEIAEE